MPETNPSQVIFRTFAVIRALNAHNGAKVGDLHKITGISRPALYRFIEALEQEGYVARDQRGGYRLTYLVRALSDGFREEDAVAEIASAELHALQRRVLWPTGYGVFAKHAIHLRESTRRWSPLVIDESVVGARLPLLETSMGLAYMAFCPSRERDEILAALAESDLPDNAIARNPARVEALIKQTQRDGYGSRWGGVVPKTGSIAVPVFFDKRVIACVCITFFASVLTPGAAAKRYLRDLRQTATNIEKGAARSAKPVRVTSTAIRQAG